MGGIPTGLPVEILPDWPLWVNCQSGRSFASAHRIVLELSMATVTVGDFLAWSGRFLVTKHQDLPVPAKAAHHGTRARSLLNFLVPVVPYCMGLFGNKIPDAGVLGASSIVALELNTQNKKLWELF